MLHAFHCSREEIRPNQILSKLSKTPRAPCKSLPRFSSKLRHLCSSAVVFPFIAARQKKKVLLYIVPYMINNTRIKNSQNTPIGVSIYSSTCCLLWPNLNRNIQVGPDRIITSLSLTKFREVIKFEQNSVKVRLTAGSW